MTARTRTFARASDTLAFYLGKQFPQFTRRVNLTGVDIVIRESDLSTIEFQVDGEVIVECPFSFTTAPPRIRIERYGTDQEAIEYLLPDIYRALDNFHTQKAV